MNAKKAKAIRKLVRASGADPKQAQYTTGKYNKRSFYGGALDSNGKPVVSVQSITGTITLVKTCGRWLYHTLKSGNLSAA